MTDPSRRRFLHVGALMGGLLLTGCPRANNSPAVANNAPPVNQPLNPPVRAQRLGVVIGGGQGGGKFFVGINDLDAQPPTTRFPEDIGFLGHGFTPRIDKPHVVMVTEKHGMGCCEFDLKHGKVLRRVQTKAGREFYGHSAFSPDGKLWYCTEANIGDGSYDGVLAVRDADSFELRPENFPTHGVSPHDCILIDDGDTLVITNGGGPVDTADEPASVAYVDVKTGAARKVLKFKDQKINAGHIAMTSRGELVCVSAPRDGIKDTSPDYIGAISFYDPKTDKFTTADDPIRARMTSETLSVAIREETMVVAATNPKGNLVTFWDFRTGLLVKSLNQFKAPRGISLTLDGKYFALSHDVETLLTLIDAETLEPKEQVVETSYISGSHNYVFDI
jgi:uncharacterized protein